MATIEADYLVIGAGATAMAFVDTLVNESDARVVMVDRNHSPGGHWNAAYPFVRLHQPSAYYGVNSRRLGSDTIDSTGPNKGYYELAGGAEVCAYFDAVMHQQLLPTGQVKYFPMSEYVGDGRVRTLGGDDVDVAARKIVDSTFVGITVPSMRRPPYDVAAGVDCIPPNELPRHKARDRYVIVGAGKTAMDTCLWLLRHGIAPERLSWIKPRDSWLLNRANVQPGPQFTKKVLADVTAQLKSVEKAESIDDLFARLADAESLLRIDESVRPEMYRCAIVSLAELEQLRRITDVVRMGHVQSIEPGRVVLDDGTVPVAASALHIDCTAVGLGRGDVTAVFDDDRITLQTVRTCQPVFSAALIGHVEATYGDNGAKNSLCLPIPNPEVPLDWLRMMRIYNENQIRWFDEPDMMAWLDSARLNILSHSTASVSPRAREKIIGVMRAQLRKTNDKLEALLA
ncbi:NAD(P)/FAD-dependent oxidoreductase [Mycobacterium sp. ITM-2016-00318]|uniref:NAD(P)/FAD-dependent oxidoreductase n=1 Tax=Mycobacterium sp. ITM-2016-00318 TaxID=2099693 RepID=UPI0018EBDC43|nr:NAD(P)/FAD-dependent oxidoreductase [Mycobacterium sp. ITM-2016-00318]WNG92131.1 NAD(P)/FAD-dependent oxidoreductase [Mycobacterium sp. ITM-2016-00318]